MTTNPNPTPDVDALIAEILKHKGRSGSTYASAGACINRADELLGMCIDTLHHQHHTLRTLSAEVAALREDVEERVSFEGATGELLDEVKRRYETDIERASREERERIVAELQLFGDPPPTNDMPEEHAAWVQEIDGWIKNNAADHIEANGREA